MSIYIYIRKNDYQNLGKHYLKRGIIETINRKFDKASVYFKEGLEFITCDCNSDGWLMSSGNLREEILNNNLLNENKYSFDDYSDFYFVKAYILSHTNNPLKHLEAEEAINKYLNVNQDSFGYYVRGKIQNCLSNYDNAVKDFEKACSIKSRQAFKYRIGRTKEQALKKDGIKELLKAFTSSPSSICCLKILKLCCNDKGIKLKNEESSALSYSFNNEKNWEKFLDLYRLAIKGETTEIYRLSVSKNKEISSFFSRVLDLKINYQKLGDKVSHRIKNDESNDFDYIDYQEDYYNDQLDLDQQSPEFWDNL